jgi:putative hydrolase of the HAD superfamily
MGAENMRTILGMDDDGEGVKSVSIANRQLMADFERGNISTQEFVAQIMPYCRPGTTEQDIKDAWMAMVADLPQERLDIVAQLRQQGYRIYMLSNGNDLHFDFINTTYHLDTYFERFFLSQEMHMAKPEPEIFVRVNEAIGGTPDNTVFIDDLSANRQAAEQTVGWTTFADINQLLAALNG